MNARGKTFKILNGIFWVLILPFFAHFLISLRKQNPLADLPSNYDWEALLCVLVLCYLITYCISRLSAYWDRVEEDEFKRFEKQLLFGTLGPFMLIMIVEVICFYLLEIQIARDDYFLEVIPANFLYLSLLNVFYFLVYLNKQLLMLKGKFKPKEKLTSPKKLLVYKAGNYCPLNFNEIAFIHQIDGVNWLTTFSGERHILDGSLSFTECFLSGNQFFKINRSQIVNKESIQSFNMGSFGKIKLQLINDINTTVSKGRVKAFRLWFY